MGDNKRRRKQIEGLKEVVAEHEAKIAAELKKPQPTSSASPPPASPREDL